MGNFEEAFALVMKNEGGFVDDPDDPGGRTNYGITEGFLRSIGDRRDPGQLTQDDAKGLYKKHFWNKVHGDDLPAPLAALVFDGAVNHGLGGMTKMLQEVVNAYSERPIAVDGGFGPKTLAAVQALDGRIGCLLVGLLAERRRRLYDNNPQAWKFKKGWYNRLKSCLALAAEQAINNGEWE